MSHNSSRHIPKLNDRDVISAFQHVADLYEGSQLSFVDRIGPVDPAEIETLKKNSAYFLTNASLAVNNVVWGWGRTGQDPNFDQLSISWNERRGTPNRTMTAAISSELDKALIRPLITADGGPTITTAEPAGQREILIALEGAVAKLLTETAEHRRNLDTAYLEKEAAMSARFDEQRKAETQRLDEEKRKLDERASRRQERLDAKQAELDSLQKKLDDRNNTHVRREIRTSLMTLVKDRLANFTVSKETSRQYYAVHLICILSIAALSLAAYLFGQAALPSGSDPQGLLDTKSTLGYFHWLALAKAGALIAVAIAVGTWYLKWINRWLQRIADAEFRLQQFRLDIERASWLAETVMEWKSKTDEPFPELLTTRLSTGLFEAAGSEEVDPRTPASQLAEALLGAAATTKLKLGDNELTFDRRALRKLDKNRG